MLLNVKIIVWVPEDTKIYVVTAEAISISLVALCSCHSCEAFQSRSWQP